MPVINGVYLKDFTALPGAVADADIIPIAISGDQIAYRTTVAGIVTDARVTSKLLTGLSVTGGAVVAADTILQAFGKVQNQINGKQGTITLTTTGTSGAATLVSDTLNIPNYGSALTGYVPYTGATQDVDLGAFKLNAQSLHAKGTAGNGHLGLKHQSSAATASANESSLFADSNGDMSFQNANLYLNKFVTSANSANRTYTFPDATGTVALVGGSGVGTVTSVAALTLGTTGSDLSSTVANGTTTPVITLQVPTASASNRGALSSADWTTFNNKAAALSGTINTIAYWDSSTTIASLALATYPSLTELSYVKGVTSAIQTQLNAKQATITLTTTGTSGAATFSANTLNIPNYADGGVLSLSAIGGTANANAATITGTVLNLQPADASFGGVVTTGTQTFAGAKTLTGALTGTSYNFTSTGVVQSGLTVGASAYQNYAAIFVGGSTTVGSSQYAIISDASMNGTANSAFYANCKIRAAATATNGYGLYVQNPEMGAAATLTNDYGIYIENQTRGGTLNYSIYSAGGLNYFAGATTLGAALSGTSATFSGLVTINTNTRGLVLNRDAVTNYNGIGYQTAGVQKWFVGMRENLSSNNYIIYSEVGTDILTLNQSTGAATFSSSATATAFIPSGATVPANGMYLSAANTLDFATNTTNRLRIASTGAATFSSSVAVLATGITVTIDDAGKAGYTITNSAAVKTYKMIAGIDGTSNTGFSIRNVTAGRNELLFTDAGAATFSSSVTATSFFESSSIKGKDIIKTNPLTNLNLDVIQYTRKLDESKDVRYGYSAEQIHSLMPELTDKDVTSVKYLDVHTILIAQLQQEIKELKAKLN